MNSYLKKQKPPSQLVSMAPEVLDEIKKLKGGEENLAKWQGKFLRTKQAGEKNFPEGVQHRDVSDIWIDHSVQRDIKPKHVAKIMSRFDPRICMPAAAVEDQAGRLRVYDGQHRIMACHLLGETKVPVCIIRVPNDPGFPAYAFEVCNDSGIVKASKEDIHRTLLHRWNVSEPGDEAREDEKVMRAYNIQVIFDDAQIDLEGQMTRKSKNKRGDKKHFFSHFQYAYLGFDSLKSDRKQLSSILNAIRTVYHDNEEIDQGLYIGLVEKVRLALQNREDYPILEDPDWMVNYLEVIRKATGPNAKNFTQEARSQWEHSTGVGVEGPKTMCQIMHEVFKKFYKQFGYDNIAVPHHDKDVGILNDYIIPAKEGHAEKDSMTKSFRSMLEGQQ